MSKALILLSLFIYPIISQATTFVPISIKKQIQESDGLVQGQVISISSEEQDGLIVSKVTVLANKWMNVENEESFVDIYYPGGKIGDRVNKVQGSPKFQIGENVILFTKIHRGKNWVNNLGLGKFSMKKIGKREIMINQIFPSHPEVGQMGVKKFYDLSEWVKKEKFSERFKNKYELNMEKEARQRGNSKNKGRRIASAQDSITNNTNKLPAFWLVVILGVLGISIGVIRNKSS